MSPTPTWPLDDEVAALDAQIATLQRAADQAQASSAMAAGEVAIARNAIRELISAKAEILEKGRLWERETQLQRALAERNAVADRVRQALAAGGPLPAGLKTALEERLKPKLNLAATDALDDDADANSLKSRVQKAEDDLGDAAVAATYTTAEANLKAAEDNYKAKAEAAEAAWTAIQNGALTLQAKLQQLQARFDEAERLEAAAEEPTPGSGGDPAVVAASAVEAGIAWKSFNDTYQELIRGTTAGGSPGTPDDGETALRDAWSAASQQAKDALAEWLSRKQEWAAARNAYEQRQALRPARKPEEQAAMVASVLAAYNPPPPGP
jgi:hypothetical protein